MGGALRAEEVSHWLLSPLSDPIGRGSSARAEARCPATRGVGLSGGAANGSSPRGRAEGSGSPGAGGLVNRSGARAGRQR